MLQTPAAGWCRVQLWIVAATQWRCVWPQAAQAALRFDVHHFISDWLTKVVLPLFVPDCPCAPVANIKVLVFSNVETFITFRSATPLVLSIFDYLFLGRELPGRRSILSIMLLVGSCAGYTYFDQGFHVQAYTWLCVWCGFFLFEACYVKHVCDTVTMTTWGRVYYTNLLAAIALVLVFPFCTAEHTVLKEAAFNMPQVLVLFMSCAIGMCMSHAGEQH